MSTLNVNYVSLGCFKNPKTM